MSREGLIARDVVYVCHLIVCAHHGLRMADRSVGIITVGTAQEAVGYDSLASRNAEAQGQ